ncbi:MAG: ubiquitin-like protein UBact [Chthonomonadales bacterium]|nr:ubiquitin-like protein UBact [Chthonomonadales bacterium]
MIAQLEERITRPTPATPDRKSGDGEGPVRPNVRRPGTDELLRRMRRVDPDAARKYRQRSGE